MNALLHAHSGLRFLILLVAVAALVVFGLGLAQKKQFTKGARILGSVFAGLVDLQVTLGLVMVLMGVWYPKLIGHVVMMVAAAGSTHVLLIRNRKQTPPGYLLPLVAVVVALVLIVGGIFAIGRSPLAMSVLRDVAPVGVE